MKRFIVPSLLAADFAHLARDTNVMAKAGASSVQLDVMDGHFVPNITLGPVVLESLRKQTKLFLDVHLMIENPENYLEVFAKAGADLLTVHWEACKKNPKKIIQQIKKLGKKAGMAIRPKTSARVLYDLLPQLDLALVMTVEPGFGGQAFMPEMLSKVIDLRTRIDRNRYSCDLQVDGGINLGSAQQAAWAGANQLVAGSAVYGKPNPIQAFKQLQKLVNTPIKDR